MTNMVHPKRLPSAVSIDGASLEGAFVKAVSCQAARHAISSKIRRLNKMRNGRGPLVPERHTPLPFADGVAAWVPLHCAARLRVTTRSQMCIRLEAAVLGQRLMFCLATYGRQTVVRPDWWDKAATMLFLKPFWRRTT